MPPLPDLSCYTLPDAEAREIFTTKILAADLPPTLTRHPRRSRPLAVLIVGQTGAGKTRSAPAILDAMTRIHPPAHLIADLYKVHHPSYATLVDSDTPAQDALASPATDTDAGRWLAMAVAEAVDRKLDVLLESACRHSDDFRELASMFGKRGYCVEVVVLAVPAALSMLSFLLRFYERLPEARSSGDLPILFTPVKIHDDSYGRLMSVAECIDDMDFIHRVLVVRRGNLVAFADEKTTTTTGGRLQGKVTEAVESERRRPLTKDERAVVVRDLEKLTARNARLAEQVMGLLEPLLMDEDKAFPELRPLVFPPGVPREALLTFGEA
ncbi:zeta toxin [Colletotrichum nymphaeae SA-01]|uniref:Zeta toxin n=1 Tax=Colletotrichum nymphaeae SA-01 TaxID=1460502 RepID=A0A135RXA0_9PEZI|nr:zeta toxin [Colletotrichum nymphaeae SA-01]